MEVECTNLFCVSALKCDLCSRSDECRSSKKVVSNDFKPQLCANMYIWISPINTLMHLDKPYSVFVHYQFTFSTANQESTSMACYS